MIIYFINNHNKILYIVLIFMKNLFETLIFYLYYININIYVISIMYNDIYAIIFM